MTTNQTMDEIKAELENAAKKDVNIKINYSIDTVVDFLDVTIVNEDSHLRTFIYHKPAAEPYILPYTSDHPRHIHRNIAYAALLRAARICSSVDDFSSECVRIDLSLLLNNYPPSFITQQFQRFFRFNNAIAVSKELNEQVYHRLHRTLLNQPTRREKQLHKMMQDPIISPLALQPKIWDYKTVYPRYLFDNGQSIGLPQVFYEWWRKYYMSTELPTYHVKVRLIAITQRTLENFFIRKKPPQEILTKMEPI